MQIKSSDSILKYSNDFLKAGFWEPIENTIS